jgi:hypothetical protein
MPVCASIQLKCFLQGAQLMWCLIDIGGGYNSQSCEFTIHHTLTLPIPYSPLSPNCHTRSRINQQEPIDNIIHMEPPS